MASVGAASCERCKQNGTAIIPGWDSSTMWYVLWVPQHSRREATSSENVPAITIKHSGPVFPPPPRLITALHFFPPKLTLSGQTFFGVQTWISEATGMTDWWLLALADEEQVTSAGELQPAILLGWGLEWWWKMTAVYWYLPFHYVSLVNFGYSTHVWL